MAQQAEIKRNIASLIGGIFIAIFVFVLVQLLMGAAMTPLAIAAGLAIAVPLGIWVRLADL